MNTAIWSDRTIENDTYAEFKDSFVYEKGSAYLYISADSEYAVKINGENVYAGQYADFPWYKVYDKINVTKYLHRGRNEINILVWYCGDNNFCHYINRGLLWYKIQSDGREVARSSEKTLCRRAPHFMSGNGLITWQLGYSFTCDLGSGGEAYHNAVEIGAMPEKMFLRPVRRMKTGKKKRAKKTGNVYDLGGETVGYPYIVFRAKKGESVTVSFGERTENGHVLRKIDDRDFSFRLIGSGKKEEAVNYLRKLGCRYFEVAGECDVYEIGLLPVTYPFRKRKYCFDGPLRKAIYEGAVKTLLACAGEHYYDCPWREQALYGLDSRFQMRYGYAAFHGSAYQRANLRLLSEDKTVDGLLSITVPSSTDMAIPSFTLWFIVAVTEYTEQTGDLSLVRKYYTKLTGLLNTFLSGMREGLAACFQGKWNFYEWADTLNGLYGQGRQPEFDCVLNCLLSYTLNGFAGVCRTIEKTVDAERYDALKRELNENIRSRFYDGERGLFRTADGEERFSELANALAVLCGAAEGESAKRICEELVRESDMIKTTLSMKAVKYDALLSVSQNGYRSYILDDIDKCYGKMLKSGADTFWETEEGGAAFHNAGSLCHGWSAMPVYYYKLLGAITEKEKTK